LALLSVEKILIDKQISVFHQLTATLFRTTFTSIIWTARRIFFTTTSTFFITHFFSLFS